MHLSLSILFLTLVSASIMFLILLIDCPRVRSKNVFNVNNVNKMSICFFKIILSANSEKRVFYCLIETSIPRNLYFTINKFPAGCWRKSTRKKKWNAPCMFFENLFGKFYVLCYIFTSSGRELRCIAKSWPKKKKKKKSVCKIKHTNAMYQFFRSHFFVHLTWWYSANSPMCTSTSIIFLMN